MSVYSYDRTAARKNTVPMSAGYGRAEVSAQDGEVTLKVGDSFASMSPANARKLAKFLTAHAGKAEKG